MNSSACLGSPDRQLVDAVFGRIRLAELSSTQAQALTDASAFHGTDGLIWEQLRKQVTQGTPQFATLTQRAKQRSQWELAHAAALTDLLSRFELEQVPALLLKGSALAYLIYPMPSLRARGDSDVLVSETNRQRAAEILLASGYRCTTEVNANSLQASYERVDAGGARQMIDLHWAVLNSPLLAQLWSFDQLYAESQAIPTLSASARAPAKVDALIHACLHWLLNRLVPYHYATRSQVGGDRLIWLYDLHLLAQSLSATERDAFYHRMSTKRLAGLCLPALSSAQAALQTASLEQLIAQIQPLARWNWRAWALSGGWLRRMLAELAVGHHRIGHLRELLFASPQALRANYPNDSRSDIRLQLQRWVDGINRRNRR